MLISDWSSDVCSSDLFKGNRFVPVDSEFERLVLGELVELRRTLDRAGWDLSIEKPLFDTLTPTGACRPDFILEACARRTGEIRRIVVEAMGSSDPDYLASKAVTHPRMMQIAPISLIRSEEHTSELQSLMRTSYAVS